MKQTKIRVYDIVWDSENAPAYFNGSIITEEIYDFDDFEDGDYEDFTVLFDEQKIEFLSLLLSEDTGVGVEELKYEYL